MQTRKVTPLFTSLAVAALAVGCGSEQPSSTNNGLGTSPTASGPYMGECPSPDQTWIFSNCSLPNGPCHSADGKYQRTNCQDPNTQTPPGAGPTAPVGPPQQPVGSGTTVTPVGPGTVTPVGPGGTVPPGASVPVGPAVPPVNPSGTDVVPPTGTGPDVNPMGTDPAVPGPAPTDTQPAAMELPPPEGRTCPVYEGLIADFEESSDDVLAIEGRAGAVEGYGDTDGTQTTMVEDDGTDACNKGVLHTSGSGFSSYVGIGTVFAGTWDQTKKDGAGEYVPDLYDATTAGYTGISFRAKKGAGQANPVRFSLSTPWTEGGDYGDGTCVDEAGDPQPCWNHLGHFLIDDEELGTDWKTFTFYFDRDLYPMWLPNGVSTENRRKVGSNLLKIQFQFNQSFDPMADPVEQVAMDSSFDFYVDDIHFVKSIPTPAIFASTDGASHPFGSNGKLGTCDAATDAALFNTAISQAYARWKATFVDPNSGAVISPEQQGKVTSEGISYGMLISAAMGDRPTFDKIWGWGSSHMSGGLVGWDNGTNGSATDADIDIAYALVMADKQWGGYAKAAQDMGNAAHSNDLDGDLLNGGSMYKGVYNPSYFAPGYLRTLTAAMAGSWDSVISANYQHITECDGTFGAADGILPDWCSSSMGAQVTSDVCAANESCSGYDASRIPYRLGFDLCQGHTDGSMLIQKMMATFASLLDVSGRWDLLKAGMNAAHDQSNSVAFEMAFLGTAGVGAMGNGDAAARDTLFRATLDVIERPEYYKTYYSTSLGMITLLMMSGNWPAL
ncbi:MAG TPA: glycosyl hydrolase family 8 [Polyangiaceae bacterium]|nr:glycosyl hydrolase family 8 [Polyangiaceae bacterium]